MQHNASRSSAHCAATTSAGQPCSAWATKSGFCAGHSGLVHTSEPHATPASGPDTCQDTQALRCSGTKQDGTQCKGTVGLVDGLCSIHRGLADPAAAARQRAVNEAARKEQAEAAAARRTLTLKQALAERAATEREALVDALFAPLADADVGSMARQAAARTILERLLGKPTEQIAQEEQPEDVPLETLVEMWKHTKAQQAGIEMAQNEDEAQ